jgi:hypothetical protein
MLSEAFWFLFSGGLIVAVFTRLGHMRLDRIDRTNAENMANAKALGHLYYIREGYDGGLYEARVH